MLRYIIIALLFTAGGAGVWLKLQPQSQPQSKTVSQPPPSPPPVLDIQGNPIPAKARTEARRHIQDISPPAETPLNIDRAQHFVTADQLLQLPLISVQTDANLEPLHATAQASSTNPLFSITESKDTTRVTRTNPTAATERDNTATGGETQTDQTTLTAPKKHQLADRTAPDHPDTPYSASMVPDKQPSPAKPQHTQSTITAPQNSHTATLYPAPATLNVITITHGVSTTEQPAQAVAATVPTTKDITQSTQHITEQTPDNVTVRAILDAGLTVTPLTPTLLAPTASENTSVTTAPHPRNLQNTTISSENVTTIPAPNRITETTHTSHPLSLLPDAGRQVRLKELLDHPEKSANKIYYIHAVHPQDDQGLWGIIQNALTRSFAEGINLPGSEVRIQAMAHIPENADERLSDMSSSFLGQFLQRKVNESYSYNYEKGMLGRNPNLIKPGQQLVIITFTEEELMQIYQFFTTAQASQP